MRYVAGLGSDCGGRAKVRVLDLDDGTESIVHNVQLHDGTPEPIWAADGSGFLYQFENLTWGVTPLDGGPVVQGIPTILSRRFRLEPPAPGARAELLDALEVGRAWLGDELAPAVPVAGQNAADGRGIWLLLDDSRGAAHQAILARLTDPGVVAEVHRFDVPQAVSGLRLSDDDTFAALYLGLDEPWPFVLAPIGDGHSTATSAPIDGLLAALVPASADTWPGE